ncbi:MAG: hypothetical protein CMA71_03695 [Euryarchaeota archaeon]|nr:hypothetical protein [Euryarchaeota archaeon]
MWSQPSENSLCALRHGMVFADGVEFDIRMDAEGELVIFHDEFLPGSGSIKPRCIENIYTDDLRKQGVLTFAELIKDREFLELWKSGSKTVDIEIKMPHPVVGKENDSHLASILERIRSMTNDLDLPSRSTIVSSFSPRISRVSKNIGFEIAVTQLVPRIRPWGRYWRVKRVFAIPQFVMTSVPYIARKFRSEGMDSIGMALEYLKGWEKYSRFGPSVGLNGKGLERLHNSLKGMGVFVWPAPLELEDSLIRAGVSIVSDHMNPDVVSKPDGSFRWPRPASQPLDDEWMARLSSSTLGEKADLIKEAGDNLPSWSELSRKRKSEIISEQGRRMLWEGSEESWNLDHENGIPWGSPRIIGHRGSGKTHGW